jgi:predicted RNA-binding protein with EMAP domain
VFRLQLNKKFNIKISKIHFSYSEGNQYVEAEFVSERSDQIQKLRSHLEDESLSNWLEDFLNPFGLNVELNVDFDKKIEIIAFEIEIAENPEER